MNNGREDAVDAVLALTDGLGADVARRRAAGAFELCTELIRPVAEWRTSAVLGHEAATARLAHPRGHGAHGCGRRGLLG